MYCFPQGTRSAKFQKLKGVFLANQSVSKTILGEAPEIFCFQMNSANQKHQ